MIKEKKTQNVEKQKEFNTNQNQLSNLNKNVKSQPIILSSKDDRIKIKDEKQKPKLIKKNASQLKTKSDLKIGNVYTFKITAIGANQIGIDEFSYGFSVLIPNAQLGDIVKAKLVKIQFKKYKYAVAEVIQKLQSSTNSELNNQSTSEQIPKIGETLEVTIEKSGPKLTGIVALSKNYFLIVPNTIPGQKVNVQITRIKSKFAFAKVLSTHVGKAHIKKASQLKESFKLDSNGLYVRTHILSAPPRKVVENQKTISDTFHHHEMIMLSAKPIKEGSKINVLLPVKLATKTSVDTSYGSSFGLVLKLNGISKDGTLLSSLNKKPSTSMFSFINKTDTSIINSAPEQGHIILFVKQTLGAKPGDRVKIQLVKVIRLNGLRYLAIGKIIEVNPMSSIKKLSLIRGNIRQMLKNEMHFGEKVVKVNARMKKYIWLRKKGQNKNKPFVQNGRNIINLLKTRRCLNKALIQLSKYAVKGRTFLFLGTKKPAAELIKKVSLFTKNSFFVNTRWIGGMLTNWKSIKKSIQKISPILKEKQTIINAILEKRQNIRKRLLKKGLVLRKKSKLLIKKARALLLTLKDEKNKTLLIQKTQTLNLKRNQRLEKSQNLIEKYNKLLEKKTHLIQNSLVLKQKASFVKNKYKNIIYQLAESQTKLKEVTTLFVLGKQIGKIQELAKEQNIRLGLDLNLKASEDALSSSQQNATFLPNPPQDILNKISLLLSKSTLTFNDGKAPIKKTPPQSSVTKSPAASLPAYKKPAVAIEPLLDELKNSSTSTENLGDSAQKQQKVLILKKFLTEFSNFVPFIRSSIQIQRNNIKNLEQKLMSLKDTLQKIQMKIQSYISLNKKLKIELNKIKLRFAIERKIIRRLRTKIKQISAQKRLIQYLPKLRYLPTPQIKITETVKYLMKNIVDPKLKYPIELIYDQRVKNQSKKIGAARKKKWQRLEKYFGGISKMTKMKKNQISKIVAIIIGQQEQINAVRECKKLGIKMFNIVDTNCNPNLADHFIPANDDSRNSIKYILTAFLTRIKLAEKIRLRLKKTNTLSSSKIGGKQNQKNKTRNSSSRSLKFGSKK